MRYYLGILFAVIVLVIPWMAMNYPSESRSLLLGIENAGSELAAVIVSHNPKTIADLRADYRGTNSSGVLPVAPKKVRILLVPGHEPNYGGAEYGSLYERNMTVELAQDLQKFLAGNSRYQVVTTRDTAGWNPVFADYFKADWNDISAWEQAHKTETVDLERLGQFHTTTPAVEHQTVPNDVAMRIYGIDKWVDENDVDIVIHIHFNDYPTHPRGTPGKYTGFAIYVPEKQYDNSTTTHALADSVFKRIAKYNPVSDLPGESSGIVEDQDLIAIGAYNSVDAASMLIEYGYIYEPQFTDSSLHAQALNDLAFQTYLGLQDFFDPSNAVNLAGSFDTLLVPHPWRAPVTADSSSADIYALQTELLLDGDYPPARKDFNDCPRTGSIGPCTKAALDVFQKKYGISGEAGTVGMKTVGQLNKLFGAGAGAGSGAGAGMTVKSL